VKAAILLAAVIGGCAAGLVGPPRPVAAQERFTVEGYVVDADSKQPIIAGVVELQELKRRVFTDSLGFFAFPGVIPGHYTLTAGSLGYSTVTEAADFQQGFTAFMLIPPRPIMLAALEVTYQRVDARRRASGFSSDAFGVKTLASVPETTLDDFLKTYANVQLIPCPSGIDQATGPAGERECMLARGVAMPAKVYLDENPSAGGTSVIESYRTGEVARVEVYRGLSMIRIYTRSFLERVARGKAYIDPVCLVCTGP